MKCPRCQHENVADAKFCEECAAPLARACAKCGRQLSLTAKFCPECAHPIADSCTRRRFLNRTLVIVAASMLRPRAGAAEPPPEASDLRMVDIPDTCGAPLYVAAELLRAEGFKDVTYLPSGTDATANAVTAGEFDIYIGFIYSAIRRIDRGAPIVFLAGTHAGCAELFTKREIRSLRDLKGRTIAIRRKDPLWADYGFVASLLAHVGLHPDRDVNFVTYPPEDWSRLLAEGKIDAFPAGPPNSLGFRSANVGHVLVNNAVHRPWAQYFCCMVIASRRFLKQKPVAVKRALRAILKATDLCAVEPDRVARLMVDRGNARREQYQYVLESLKELPYGKWREYDPEDAVRFYALRLREAGLIEATPQTIINRGTDWRLLQQLRRELKA
jgi:NitT/TauT family transport system substrate-binding protein